MSWIKISITHVLANLSAEVYPLAMFWLKSLCCYLHQPCLSSCMSTMYHVYRMPCTYAHVYAYCINIEVKICFHFYLLTLLPFSVNRSDDRVCDGRVDCMNGEDEDQNLCGNVAHGASSGHILNQQFSALSLPDMDSDHFKASFFKRCYCTPRSLRENHFPVTARASLLTLSALPRNNLSQSRL